jgi:membrane protease YdiL (CAAX protease family)
VGAALIAVGLLAYNNLVNLWRGFSGVAYVPLNLAVTGVVLAAGGWGLDLTRDEMGLGWGGLGVGLAIGAALAAPVVVLGLIRRTAGFVADRRLAGVTAAGGLFVVALRIPIGTALLEEVAFRGVLYGAWRGSGAIAAAVASSAVFALWHVTPTVNLVRANRPSASAALRTTVVAAGAAFTCVAGLGFAWLRDRYGSIAAPWALHATVNSLSAAAALVALRRSRR